jgi:glutamine cyclotransferase
MKTKFPTRAGTVFLLLIFSCIISCSCRSGGPDPVTDPAPDQQGPERVQRSIVLNAPAENASFRFGSSILIDISAADPAAPPDSVVIAFDGKRSATLTGTTLTHTLEPSLIVSTGRKALKITAFTDGRAGTTITRFLIIMSDKVPQNYSYKIVKTYPHDPDAYTQGLFFHKGFLYEGTGQEGRSSLREVDPETGKIIRQHNLSPELFGEGITLFNDQIYQVTWRSKVGFVYDRTSFSQIKRVYYQSEGWGLTTMGKLLVMSDGTNVLYFIDPEMFTVVSRLEVYDNEKQTDQLNELEFINGELWANLWLTDRIARIDPQTGRVNGYIDLKGLARDRNINELNGIAWDSENNRIFVTGKNWPKLFEISVIK